MIVAAHQPNFMPWLGYFDKMRKADLFISVDHVQMERQGFQNRVRVKTGEGPRWLTVPVVQESRGETIAEKRVDNSRDGRFRWGRKAMLTLKYAYQKAPHFAAFEPELLKIFDGQWDRLAPLNEALIEVCREGLGIKTPIVRSSQLKVTGAKSEMVLNMCREVGAEAYLAGSGASKGYLDVAAFEAAGIRVLWQEFRHPRYVQHPPGDGFAERMSAFDLLFNCGPASAAILAGEPAAAEAAGVTA
ncbi:MAG: WbqC family protein [Elusimicrobiota bacterium]|nr:MAG: WbqC family protein [Elusimicrobiota bacterium]